MSLAIGPNAECLFVCDHCSEVITDLNEGAFIHPTGQATISQLLTIHCSLAFEDEHPCWSAWHQANPGHWDSYGLDTWLVLVGVTYGDQFNVMVRLTAKRAAERR